MQVFSCFPKLGSTRYQSWKRREEMEKLKVYEKESEKEQVGKMYMNWQGFRSEYSTQGRVREGLTTHEATKDADGTSSE